MSNPFPMNKPTINDQALWDMGFDFFFERKEEQKLSFLGELLFAKDWHAGFIAGANYCEHLLKTAR